MNRYLLPLLLLGSVAGLFGGCAQTIERTVIRAQLPQIVEEEDGEIDVVSTMLVDGERVVFDSEGGEWIEDSTTMTTEYGGEIVGVDTAGTERRIPVGEIVEAQLKYTEPSVANSVTIPTTVITLAGLLLLSLSGFSVTGH